MDVRARTDPTYRFAAYRLISAAMQLTRGQEPVSITPRVFAVLLYLVERAGQTVSKDELLNAVWPNRIADEGNLSQAISAARRALASDPKASSFIVTVPGYGYRFTAAVQIEDEAVETTQGANAQSGVASSSFKRPHRRTLWALPIIAIAIGSGLYWMVVRPHQGQAGHSSVILADLQNFTGEQTLDHVVPRILQIDLAQSPFVQIMPDSRVAETLGLMEQPKTAALTPALALAVCARTNGSAVITPGIATLGRRYLLTLTAVDCATGKLLYDEKQEAGGKEDVSHAVDTLSARMRRQLGEVGESISRFDVPIASERTSSFAALHAYSEGEWLNRQGKRLEAIPFYEHAVELDPDFAMAWLAMSEVYYGFRQPVQEVACITKAYQERKFVSERDALLIDNRYDVAVTRDLDAALQSATLLVQLYPADSSAWASLANIQTRLLDLKDAIASANRALALEPQRSNAYTVLARALVRSDQLAQADQIDARALRVVPETGQIRQQRIALRYLQGDPDGGARLVISATGTPLEREALLEGYNFMIASGQVHRANAMMNRAVELGRSDGITPNYSEIAFNAWHMGALDQARLALARVPKSEWTGEDAYYTALLDDPQTAAANLKRDLAHWPNYTLLYGKYAPEARAAILMKAGKPQDAVRVLDTIGRFMFSDLDAPYLRASALLAANNPAEAAAGFRAILIHTGYAWDPQFDMAHLGLARAMRQMDKVEDSRREYQTFFTAWRNADPDVPVLRQAKAEFATLPRHATGGL